MVLVYVVHFLSKGIAKAMLIVPILKTSILYWSIHNFNFVSVLNLIVVEHYGKPFFFAELSATMNLGVHKFEQLQKNSIVNLV